MKQLNRDENGSGDHVMVPENHIHDWSQDLIACSMNCLWKMHTNLVLVSFYVFVANEIIQNVNNSCRNSDLKYENFFLEALPNNAKSMICFFFRLVLLYFVSFPFWIAFSFYCLQCGYDLSLEKHLCLLKVYG